MGLEISGTYFEYRIGTQISGISVKHKLSAKSRVVSLMYVDTALTLDSVISRTLPVSFPF